MLKPILNKVLIRKENSNSTDSGIILMETFFEKYASATVLAVCETNKILKPGDVIVYEPNTDVALNIIGMPDVTYILMDNVIAKL